MYRSVLITYCVSDPLPDISLTPPSHLPVCQIHYLAKLDAGLYTLQLVSLIWGLLLYHGPRDVREHTAKLLHQYQLHPTMFTTILDEYVQNLGDQDEEAVNAIRENSKWAILGLERLVNTGEKDAEAEEDGDATPDHYGEADADGDATP